VVGGDFYDVLPLGHGTTGIAVGDAVGHGLAAALVARDVVVGLRVALDRGRPPAGVFARLNRVLRAGLPGRAFASVVYAELRPDGRVAYVSAGHPPALCLRSGARRFLGRSGPVLGPFEQVSYRATRSRLAPGELLVLYTDGIVERRDPKGDLYGVERLAQVVEAHATEPLSEILERVFAQATDFGAGAPWSDDATLVIVRREASSGGVAAAGGRGHRLRSASASARHGADERRSPS
jgi:serine phosphatase RsbU (regulator of sigma subunit)